MARTQKKLKIFTAIATIIVLVGLLVFLFSGDNFIILQEMFRGDITREELQDSLSDLGYKGYITFGLLSMLQVILTFLPAEPVQVMAGISFGFLKGVAICTVGVFIGNTIIYMLYRIYGDKLEDYFAKNAEFDFETARHSRIVTFAVFLLYFLPAIPYGLICFFTASLGNRYWKYILLTTVGAIPSICIGVGLGHLAIASSWILSIIIFVVLVTLLIILYRYKSALFAKVNTYMQKKSQPYSSATVAKKYNPWLYRTAAFVSRLIFAPKIKVVYKNEVKKIEQPSLVLCNHGSFVDFLYAGQVLRKTRPHFVSARLYFYKKSVARILRQVGCFPKSMFTSDLENAKNCMRILSSGGTLAMMPEARLSTVGNFEGIQETTYRFIQRARVPVYTIHISGDYFAYPKWSDGIRRGSVVEVELKQLFTVEDLTELPLEEVKQRVNDAMDYNEFEWLEKHPKIRYKHKTLAEGLENILCRCPKCNARYSMFTSKKQISCEKCGFTREIDTRYAFTEPVPFENFAKWYAWQVDEMRKEMLENPDFALTEKVTLKHSSKDGKEMLRVAGQGVCRLDKTGLTYEGEEDGQQITKTFAMADIYRILFGAGEDFEIYDGSEIWFFVPENKRCCVDWYIDSGLFKELYS